MSINIPERAKIVCSCITSSSSCYYNKTYMNKISIFYCYSTINYNRKKNQIDFKEICCSNLTVFSCNISIKKNIKSNQLNASTRSNLLPETFLDVKNTNKPFSRNCVHIHKKTKLHTKAN